MSNANIDPKYALALLQAVKKGIDAKVAREETSPGVYRDIQLDLSVRVGEMRVAPDTDKAPTTSIPLLTTCALLLRKFEVAQRDRALEVLEEVFRQALDMSRDAQKELLEELGINELEKRLREEVISKLPRVPVRGAVSVSPDDVEVTIKGMSMGEDGS